MKLYLGCGPLPIHEQHLEVMKKIDEWILCDLYIDHPHIKKWDAQLLSEVSDNSVEHIYSSHLLEHLPHKKIISILSMWKRKLVCGGKITLNVPDLAWAAKQVLDMEEGKKINGYFNTFFGDFGILSVIYGSQAHQGEHHKSGFIKKYLHEALESIGFENIDIIKKYEAHDMGCLLATAQKP